jgi:hypothetical protein
MTFSEEYFHVPSRLKLSANDPLHYAGSLGGKSYDIEGKVMKG